MRVDAGVTADEVQIRCSKMNVHRREGNNGQNMKPCMSIRVCSNSSVVLTVFPLSSPLLCKFFDSEGRTGCFLHHQAFFRYYTAYLFYMDCAHAWQGCRLQFVWGYVMSIKFTTVVCCTVTLHTLKQSAHEPLLRVYLKGSVFDPHGVITTWEHLQARCGAFSAEGLDNKGFRSWGTIWRLLV